MDENVVKQLIEAGKQLARAEASQTPPDGQPFLVMPDGKVKSLEKFCDAPRRVRATITARTAQGLIDYVAKHRTPATAAFAWSADASFLAVIDYHQPETVSAPTEVKTEGVTAEVASFPAITPSAPSWCNHRVHLTLQPSQDWQRWAQFNKQQMTQEAFAAFIEDNVHCIAQPNGADLFEMVRQLYATRTVQFGSSVRLDNGQHQLRYEETVSGSAGKKGQFNTPSEFKLGLAPFEGSALYEVVARFRYRIEQGGALKLWYDMLRPELVVEAAYLAERAKVAEALGAFGIPVFDAKFGSVDIVDAV